jgi:branched-chain amino acid transport system permease protein
VSTRPSQPVADDALASGATEQAPVTGTARDERLYAGDPRKFLRNQDLGFLAACAVAVVAVVLAPAFLGTYYLTLMSLGFVYAMGAIALTILLGWSGQFAFISTSFLGLGAYSGGLFSARLGATTELSLVFGALAGAVVGAVLAMLIVRMQRYYLSIVTIAFLFVADFTWRNWEDMTGGVRGFVVPEPRFALLGGAELDGDIEKFLISFLLLGIVTLFATWLGRTRLARGWRVIRVNQQVAEALGVRIYQSKVAAIAVAGGILGLAGAWFAHLNNRVFPQTFLFDQMLIDFIFVLVGGLGYIRGAIIGAVGLNLVQHYLRGYIGIFEVVFGVALLLIVRFFPRGVYGEISARFRSFREGVV